MATDATLNIRVDSSEVQRGKKSLDDLAVSGNKAEKGVDGVTKSTTSFSSAARVATGVITSLGVAMGVREIVQYADAWQNTTNQLKTVQREGELLSATQEKLMMTANASRSGFESTANLYTRLSRATENLNLSQQETIALTDTINKSFAVSGATAQEASNAITQLSQGLAAGALRGEEFNSVSEQSPILMQAIADSLKMTRGELRAFAADGGITAEIVVKALQEASGQIDETFSKMSATFGQNVAVAKNNLLGYIGSAESVQSATSAAGSAIVFLSENLDVMGSIAKSAGFAIGAVATVQLVQFVASMEAATVAQAAFNLVAKANPYLLLATGVGALSFALIEYTQKQKEATEALRDYVQAGGALSSISKQMLQDQAARVASAAEETVIIEEITDKTQALIDALNNQISALSMSSREQEIFAARLKAISTGAGPETIRTIERLAGEYYDAKTELELWNDSIEEYLKEQKKSKDATDRQSESIQGLIRKLENEQQALQMTDRAQAIFNATTEAYNKGAGPEQIRIIATLTAHNYDLAAANDEAGSKAEAAARLTEKNWRETHDYLSGAFVDIMNNGGNAFDNIAKAFERTVQRMVAEWAASGLMNLFGIGGGSGGGFSLPSFGGGGGGGGINPSTAISLAKGAGSLLGIGSAASALPAANASAAAWGSFYGGGTAAAGAGGLAGIGSSVAGAASSAWGGITGALGAIPGWGWALIGTAAAAKMLDSGGTMSGNSGFLVRGVGGGENQFDVPAFDSGFDPVGFARREDQGAAVQVIDTFRQYDSALTAIAKASGLNVNYNSNNFGGFNEKGNGNGLFFGSANEDGRNTAVGIDQQLTQFVGQWVKGLSGQVDQSLINDVLSAGSADAMVKKAAQLAGYDGSHANGLDYVPFDNYRANLHKGEKVVSVAERVRIDDESARMSQEIAQLKQEARESKVYNRRMFEILDRWQASGFAVT